MVNHLQVHAYVALLLATEILGQPVNKEHRKKHATLNKSSAMYNPLFQNYIFILYAQKYPANLRKQNSSETTPTVR